jgi:hypothetical protein
VLGEFATRAAEVAFTDARGFGRLLATMSPDTFDCPPLAAQAAVARLLERNPAHHVPPVGPSYDDRHRSLSAAAELISALRDAGDPDAASRLEQRAFAADAYPYLRRDDGQPDYGLLPDGTWSPAWAWAELLQSRVEGVEDRPVDLLADLEVP